MVASRFIDVARCEIILSRERRRLAVIDAAIVIQVEIDRDPRQAGFIRIKNPVGIFVKPLRPVNFTAKFRVSKINPVQRLTLSDSEIPWFIDELAVERRGQPRFVGMNKKCRQLLGHEVCPAGKPRERVSARFILGRIGIVFGGENADLSGVQQPIVILIKDYDAIRQPSLQLSAENRHLGIDKPRELQRNHFGFKQAEGNERDVEPDSGHVIRDVFNVVIDGVHQT